MHETAAGTMTSLATDALTVERRADTPAIFGIGHDVACIVTEACGMTLQAPNVGPIVFLCFEPDASLKLLTDAGLESIP